MLAIYMTQYHRVGPEYLSVTRMDKSCSDPYSSMYSFGLAELHLYGYPITMWWLMQSKHPPEIVIAYGLYGLIIGSLRYRVFAMLNYVTGSHCNTLIWVCVHHIIPNDMTSLLTDICVSMIRKPWSSIAQWTSILELTRDLVVYILYVY